MTSKKYAFLQIVCFFGILLFSFIDFYMYKGGYFEQKKTTLSYKYDNDIDYKVYLKKNDFFDRKYLGKNETYITSLIDHINVDYKYNIMYDNKVTGDVKYYISATIESKKNNSEAKYWSKDYRITDEKTGKINDSRSFTILENVDIDYNKYNSILNSFKKSVGLSSSSGYLKVFLNVESNIKGNGIESPVNSKLLLKLPLSEMTIEASIDVDEQNTVKTLTKYLETEKLKLYRTVGIVYASAVVICLILLLYFTKKKKDLNKYSNTLKKILNTYDGIIVNIKKLPDLTKYQVIDVSNFNELLDAHSEVRMPINFYEEENKCYFILLSDKNAWRYGMRKVIR